MEEPSQGQEAAIARGHQTAPGKTLRMAIVFKRLSLMLGGLLLGLMLLGGGMSLATRSVAQARATTAPSPTPSSTPSPAGDSAIGQDDHLPTAPDQSLALRPCTARIADHDSAAARLGSLSGFDCTTRPLALGPGSYWLRLIPMDQTRQLGRLPADLSVISFVPGWQRSAAIYLHHVDGSVSWRSLDNRTLSHHTHIGARFQLDLRDKGARPDAILLRIDQAVNNNGLLTTPALRSEAGSNRHELMETAVYCTFAGLCLALLVFNLALLGSMREGFQLTYCLMVISMLTYAWAHSGGWSLWFPDRDITERFRLSYVSQGLMAALSLRFLIDFLETDLLPGWLRWLATALRLSVLSAAAVMAVVSLQLAPLFHHLYTIAFGMLQILSVAIGILAIAMGSRAARVLSPTWIVPMLAGSLRLAQAYGLMPQDPLSAHSPLVQMGINALFYALAIAMRVKILAEERDHARSEERLARRLADIDPLTGLLNRRGLLAQATRGGSRGSLRLLIVDVDHFKAINDTHGHDMGDEVLRELARVLSRRCGWRGGVALLGGEELAVIGTAGDLPPALALAILADVRQHRFDRGIAVTVSIGMAEGEIRSGSAGDADWSALYRRADIALYEAKSTGRNRVVDAALMEAGLGGLGTLPPDKPAADSRTHAIMPTATGIPPIAERRAAL